MQLSTFGLTLLLIFTLLMTPSITYDQADCENDDSDPEDCCIKLKERTCQRGKNNKPCSEITLYKCSPSCRLYTRKTKTSTSKNYIISTIYLCLVSTAWTTRRMSISSTMSFSPSSSRQTSSVGAIEKLLTKSSNVLSIRPTPSMSISASSSSYGTGPDCGQLDNDDDDDNDCEDSGDGDDVVSESSCTDTDQDDTTESSKTPKNICKTSTAIQSSSLSYLLSNTPQNYRLTSIPSTIVTITRISQSSVTSNSILPTATSTMLPTAYTSSAYVVKPDENVTGIPTKFTASEEELLNNVSSGFVITTRISKTVPLNITVNYTSTRASSSILPTVPTNSCILRPVSSNEIVSQKELSDSRSNVVSAITTSLSDGQIVTVDGISATLTGSLPSGIINTSTMIPKHGCNETEVSTKIISPSIFISPSGGYISTSTVYYRTNATVKETVKLTKTVQPSSVVPTLIESSNTLPTPPLSPSMSNTNVTATAVVSSWEQSTVNSTVSSNSTLNQSSTIEPTITKTVLLSSSIVNQDHAVFCSEDESGDKFEKGVFTWPKTPVGNKANISCPYNSNAAMAYRWCRMKNNSLQKWGSVHDESCSVLETNTSMHELVMKVNITEENEKKIAILIEYHTSRSKATVDRIKNGADLLVKLVEGATNLSNIRKELLRSVSSTMNADPKVLAEANRKHKSTSKILRYVGKLLDNMSLSGKKRVREIMANLVAEAWDVENKSKELRFDTRDEGDNVSLVSVALPASLVQRYTKKKRITFMNFMNDNLFPQEVDQTKRFINSKIVSASVKGDQVKNLSEPVVIEFKITNSTFANNCSCVFWDFEADGGLGQWSTNGCVYEVIGNGRSRCSCNHLTHFGILVDISPDVTIGETDRLILERITFVGCYLSIVGLVLTVITLLSFKQYRTGVSGQILLNLCLALIFSLVVFIAGIDQVDDDLTCITVAALLHYFVLVAVMWMGVEAFHMFINIVLDRLPGELGKTFVLKCAAIAWVLPLITVIITVVASRDHYKNDKYCRVNGNTFYIAFLVPAVTVMLFNVVIFFLVIKALLSAPVSNMRHKQSIVHFRRVLGIAVIFGITWLFGVLAIGELKLIFQYLFCITNTFQGFIIFILYCLTDRKVREKLVRFLCALPDPNENRIDSESTSTRRQTDIGIDLTMFEKRKPIYSNTWPMPRQLSLTEDIKDFVISYPTQNTELNYNPDVLESSHNVNCAGPGYLPHLEDTGFGSNSTLDSEPYTHGNLPGRRPVINLPLPGEASGDKLVDSTLSQLERSGGQTSLQSGNSILFMNEGRVVEVLTDNNWQETIERSDESCDDSLESHRQYIRGGDGLSFYKRPKLRQTSELDKRFVCPRGTSLRHKGVTFERGNTLKEPTRWSEMSAFPALKNYSRHGGMSETDEFGNVSRAEHVPRPMIIAEPSTCAIDNDYLEMDNLENYVAGFGRESKKCRDMNVQTSCEGREAQLESESDPQLRQSSASPSSSETSSDFPRWSEVDSTPNLKSYSQSTFSDFGSNDNADDGDGTHFTQF